MAKKPGDPLTDSEANIQIAWGAGEMIIGAVGGVAGAEVTAGKSVQTGIFVMADGAHLIAEATNKRKANPVDMLTILFTPPSQPMTKTQDGRDVPYMPPLP